MTQEERLLDPASLKKPTNFALGFHSPNCFWKAVDIDRCHIATEEMNQVLHLVKGFCVEQSLSIYSTRSYDGFLRNLVVRHAESSKQLLINLVTSWHDPDLMSELRERLKGADLGGASFTFVNHVTQRKNNVAQGEKEYVLEGDGCIHEKLGRFTFAISAQSFFQTHTLQARRLCERVLEWADPKQADRVFDLYCGIGTLASFLSTKCESVVGADVCSRSIAGARLNAKRNQLPNARFEQVDLGREGSFQSFVKRVGAPNLIVLDPPRAGVSVKSLRQMAELKPRRMVYVSCNPASLARDAKILCSEHPFKLRRVLPIDMFPQTNHVECMACFENHEN